MLGPGRLHMARVKHAAQQCASATLCRYPAAHYLDCGSAVLMNGALPEARLISRELVPDGRQPVTSFAPLDPASLALSACCSGAAQEMCMTCAQFVG